MGRLVARSSYHTDKKMIVLQLAEPVAGRTTLRRRSDGHVLGVAESDVPCLTWCFTGVENPSDLQVSLTARANGQNSPLTIRFNADEVGEFYDMER